MIELRKRISNVAELDEASITDTMLALEYKVREWLHNPRNPHYFQGAYHYTMDDLTYQGDASDEDMVADATRHNVSVDEIVEHYRFHVEHDLQNADVEEVINDK